MPAAPRSDEKKVLSDYDSDFLKSSGVESRGLNLENWMEWRDDEIRELRGSVANWINQAKAEHARGDRWKIIAFAGWAFAAILFFAPLVERWTR